MSDFKKSMQKVYNDIYKDLVGCKNEKIAERNKRFHKNKIPLLGIKASLLDKIFKKHKKNIESVSCKEVFRLAEMLYSKRIEEFVLMGNFVLQNRIECITKSKLSFLDKSLDYFCSWSTVDNFCIDILQPLLLKYPNEVLLLLEKWNRSNNLWKRRLSVIAFVRKIGISGKFTNKAIFLCEKLIWDEEDLVKKGVGWCLKDIMQGDKRKALKYVKDLRKRDASSVIILYSIRNLAENERKEVLKI